MLRAAGVVLIRSVREITEFTISSQNKNSQNNMNCTLMCTFSLQLESSSVLMCILVQARTDSSPLKILCTV